MARSTPAKQQSGASASSAICDLCGASIKRTSDLPRHMLLHAENKEKFMFVCPVEGCNHQTLQKSNLATHIRTHTRSKPFKCPEFVSGPTGPKCDFATADPSSLHRHRKRKHGYKSQPSGLHSPPTPSTSTREQSVESDGMSVESEESFGLRPVASEDNPPLEVEDGTEYTRARSRSADDDPPRTPSIIPLDSVESTTSTSSHDPYLPCRQPRGCQCSTYHRSLGGMATHRRCDPKICFRDRDLSKRNRGAVLFRGVVDY